jgi:hypothetical protein
LNARSQGRELFVIYLEESGSVAHEAAVETPEEDIAVPDSLVVIARVAHVLGEAAEYGTVKETPPVGGAASGGVEVLGGKQDSVERTEVARQRADGLSVDSDSSRSGCHGDFECALELVPLNLRPYVGRRAMDGYDLVELGGAEGTQCADNVDGFEEVGLALSVVSREYIETLAWFEDEWREVAYAVELECSD